MQRYMVNGDLGNLNVDDKRHIINVMRMNIGELFEIVCNKKVYKCKITDINKKDLKYEVVSVEDTETKLHKIIIASSIIKEQKMDYLLQKSTELGVDEIIPLISERTVIKVENKIENKINRWGKILKEASEQSFRNDIPKIDRILNLKDIVNYNANIKIVCDTSKNAKNIKNVLQDMKKSDTILVVVGPEGGFSEKEIKYLNDNGFVSVSLGKNILRAETVPLYILSVINYNLEV